jgi:uncharacterized protein DUF4412
MRRLLIAFLACIALPAWAGVTYEFRSTSSGMRESALTGRVTAEGSHMRMDLTSGDDFLFKANSFVLTNDGGRTLQVFDPTAKTYYIISLNDLMAQPGSMLGNLGGSVKFQNPKVSVRDLGAGETISGYPTHHAIVDAEYDVAIDVMGNQMTSHMTMSTESWTTDRLEAAAANFLQTKEMRTGFADLDKLLDAQAKAINGRFPVKQVTTIHVQQGGADLKSITTSEVANIEKKPIAASTFQEPTGYTKVDDPISRMMKNLK